MTRARATADTQDNNGGSVPPFVAAKNKILNSDFSIWQRGTSFTGNEIYTADRWYYLRDGSAAATISRQSFSTGTAPVAGYEGSFFLRYNQTTAGTGGTYNQFQQPIEDVRVFAGQTATVSFWAKADTSRSISVNLRQDFGSGGSSGVSTTFGTANLTTSWTRYSFTVAVPSIVGTTIGTNSSLRFIFILPVNTTQTIDIWGVQLEAGSVATPFTTATGTIQGELAACQRYYYRIGGSSSYEFFGQGTADSTTKAVSWVQFPVTMRTNPTSLDYSTLMLQNNGGSAVIAVTSATLYPGNASSRASFGVYSTVASGLTQGTIYSLFSNNSTSGYVGFSAEL